MAQLSPSFEALNAILEDHGISTDEANLKIAFQEESGGEPAGTDLSGMTIALDDPDAPDVDLEENDPEGGAVLRVTNDGKSGNYNGGGTVDIKYIILRWDYQNNGTFERFAIGEASSAIRVADGQRLTINGGGDTIWKWGHWDAADDLLPPDTDPTTGAFANLAFAKKIAAVTQNIATGGTISAGGNTYDRTVVVYDFGGGVTKEVTSNDVVGLSLSLTGSSPQYLELSGATVELDSSFGPDDLVSVTFLLRTSGATERIIVEDDSPTGDTTNIEGPGEFKLDYLRTNV